jgi:hypothetical protein
LTLCDDLMAKVEGILATEATLQTGHEISPFAF